MLEAVTSALRRLARLSDALFIISMLLPVSEWSIYAYSLALTQTFAEFVPALKLRKYGLLIAT
ncbi:hypothetical protein NTD86_08815 [Pseudomonas sp. 7P_10.2_Bac1]|uniref:hypothetical protein n=1 Tax=Pseudomonas sp. 7P_10.2_Bac1 TaxID=2971614 RepID=UPI0021C725FB|nr:hypothetical protein [Pseudomonas sp. 7P_10.2_Bac1]MCU1727088.1 hypothetical protein [Pseudomonas sp. 7P_10.2_Bac1]